MRPGNPAVVDVFLPMGCGLEPGDRVRWVLRDAIEVHRHLGPGYLESIYRLDVVHLLQALALRGQST